MPPPFPVIDITRFTVHALCLLRSHKPQRQQSSACKAAFDSYRQESRGSQTCSAAAAAASTLSPVSVHQFSSNQEGCCFHFINNRHSSHVCLSNPGLVLCITWHYVEIIRLASLPVSPSYKGLLKKPCLVQYIPDPHDFFKPLYHTYQGDFKVREHSGCVVLNILRSHPAANVNQRKSERQCVSEGILCVKYSISIQQF